MTDTQNAPGSTDRQHARHDDTAPRGQERTDAPTIETPVLTEYAKALYEADRIIYSEPTPFERIPEDANRQYHATAARILDELNGPLHNALVHVMSEVIAESLYTAHCDALVRQRMDDPEWAGQRLWFRPWSSLNYDNDYNDYSIAAEWLYRGTEVAKKLLERSDVPGPPTSDDQSPHARQHQL